MTQADSARALGMPPDGVETPALTDAPLSHTHELKHVTPSQIRRDDIYKHNGQYHTVSSVIQKTNGGVAVYFRADDDTLTPPADISDGVYAVSVWRPKGTDSYV